MALYVRYLNMISIILILILLRITASTVHLSSIRMLFITR